MQPRTLTWFVRHEFRLAWRDWLARITAGGRRKPTLVAIALILFIAFRPASAAEVFRSIGNSIMDIATGFGDFFTNLMT